MKEMIAFPSSLFCICIDEFTEASTSARLFSCYKTEAVRVKDLCMLLLEMEAILERSNYPQPASIVRSFQRISCQGEEAEMKMSETAIRKKKGKTATFVVRITHRQNATWQGNVLWSEENKSQHFRSALELLKLMDSALIEAEFAEEKNDNSVTAIQKQA